MIRIRHSGKIVFAFFVIATMIAGGGIVCCDRMSGTLRRLLFPHEGPRSGERAADDVVTNSMPRYASIGFDANDDVLSVGWTEDFSQVTAHVECYWCTDLVDRVWTPFHRHEIIPGETNFVFRRSFATNRQDQVFYGMFVDVLSIGMGCESGLDDSSRLVRFAPGDTIMTAEVYRTSRPAEFPPHDPDFAADPFCHCDDVSYDPLSHTVSIPKGGAYPLPDGSLLVSLRPLLSFGTPHYYTGPDYPLDSEYLWDGWHRGMSFNGCDCRPEFRLDPDADLALYGMSNRLGVAGNMCWADIFVGSNIVWSGTCYHDVYPDHYSRSDELSSSSSDEDGDECECGDEDSLDGPSLGSVRFRLSLGMPRSGMVSGFLYFNRNSTFVPRVGDFLLMKRSDAEVSDDTSAEGTVRRIVCSDSRGRTLTVSNTTFGVRIFVDSTLTRERICTWEISSDSGVMRFRKLSLAGNAILDKSYSVSSGAFVETDNFSGLAKIRSEADCETEEISTMGGRTVRRVIVRHETIGDGENAVERETERRELGAGGIWKCSYAEYWNDSRDVRRHGSLRYEYGDDRPWRYHDYDMFGRETLLIEQRNGSQAPGLDVYSPDDLPSSDCTVTVYSYQLQSGDSDAAGDFRKWRREDRYVKENGSLILVSRTWRKFTRALANGYPCVVVTTERACSQSAALGDSGNAVSSVTCFADDLPDVPYVLRGETAEETGEDGVTTVYERTVSGDSVRTVERRFFNGHEAKTRNVSITDGFGNPRYEATALTADGTEFDSRTYSYDDRNRLRRITYADGSYETNAYSCCRLLWSIDRNGAKTSRIAETGTDRLHYAIEDEYLDELPRQTDSSDGHRITHRYMDGLGRLTNTVVTATGESAPVKSEFVSYPQGFSYPRVSVSSRGLVTRERSEGDEASERYYRDVYDSLDSIVPARSEYRDSFRGGIEVSASSMNGEGDSVHSGEYYNGTGERIDIEEVFPRDGDVFDRSWTAHDFLGRAVTRISPHGCSEISYVDGREYSAFDRWSGIVETNLYDECGELVGSVSRGVVRRTDTDYERFDGALWKVERELEFSGSETNRDSVVKTRLTGLSDSLRAETIRYEFGVEVEHVVSSFDPATKIMTEVSVSPLSGTNVVESMFGKTIHVSSAGEQTWNYYDAFGRVVYVEKEATGLFDRRPYSWRRYDSVGDLVAEGEYTNATGSVATGEYEYDVFGNVSQRTDASCAVVTNVYDAEGHLLARGGDTHPVRYAYGYEGQMKSLSTTRDGHTQDTTRWTYDVARGLVTGKVYADGSEDSFAYDPDGRPLSVTNPDGSSYGYEYGEFRDLERIVSADPSCRYGFVNDDRGRILLASNSVWSTSYSYDVRGRVTEESVSVAGETRQLCRDYDAYGRLTRISVSGALDVDIIYDDRGRIAALSNGEFRVDYRYVGDSLDTGCDLGLSTGAVFSRRLLRNPYAPDEIVAVSNIVNGIASVLAYGYDSLHRPIVRNADSFAYNLRGEVAAATISGRSETHAYDCIGNEYESNCLNQPIWVPEYGGVWYDTCGRVEVHHIDSEMPAFLLTYDAMHRLASASLLAEPYTLVQSNVYDNAGRRVMKYAPDGVHRYYYDDWLLRLETITASDDTVTTIEYVWGKDISGTLGGAAGIGGLLYTKINGVIYVPQYDAYGNIISYCDAAGNIVASYTYDAFGRTISQSGALADVFAFRYSTKYFDRETGFYYYGKRYYSPALRRWLTRDPIGENGGLNLYGFCTGNSVSTYDILGAFAIKVISKWTKSWLFFEWTEEVEVRSCDDINIQEVYPNNFYHGKFVYPAADELSFSGCELKIPVVIRLRSNLIDRAKGNVKYYYKLHKLVGSQMVGGGARTSDGSPLIRASVLAHENGHAKSYLENAMPSFISAVNKKYTGRAIKDLTAAEIKDIRNMYQESVDNAMDDSCDRSNLETINWYNSHGIQLQFY